MNNKRHTQLGQIEYGKRRHLHKNLLRKGTNEMKEEICQHDRI